MIRGRWFTVGLLSLTLIAHSARAETRNPFGVADVKNPLGEDIQKFAEGRNLPGGNNDKNAEQWVANPTNGKAGSLDGDWSGRWEEGAGTAKIKTVGDRVYVLYTDHEGPFSDQTWLLEAVRRDNRLVGRWAQVGNPDDTGPYIGLIANDERIDGAWGSINEGPVADRETFAPNTRWDFRRKLKIGKSD